MKFSNSQKELSQLFKAIFEPYANRVEDVSIITNAMIEEGIIEEQGDIVNDHVAFRTLGVPNLGIQSLEKIFLHFGYRKMDYYYFEKKKLDAYWYAPPSEDYPRIFISELRVAELSENAQEIITKYTNGIEKDPVDVLDFSNVEETATFFNEPLWQLPTLSDYQMLAEESEYASWVIYNRFYLNHYTISIHDLPNGYSDLEKFNLFLENKGVVLNESGGTIKVSGDGLLRQSSSVAKLINAVFSCGNELKIPGSYVEFAQRFLLPEFAHLPMNEITGEHRREGFESANADKIFESTYSTQTSRL